MLGILEANRNTVVIENAEEWEDDEKPSAKMPPPATPARKKPEPNFKVRAIFSNPDTYLTPLKVPEPKGATPNAK